MKVSVYTHGNRKLAVNLFMNSEELKHLGNPKHVKIMTVNEGTGTFVVRPAKDYDGYAVLDQNIHLSARGTPLRPETENFRISISASKVVGWKIMRGMRITRVPREFTDIHGIKVIRFRVDPNMPIRDTIRKPHKPAVAVKETRAVREVEPLYKPEEHPPGAVVRPPIPEEAPPIKPIFRHPRSPSSEGHSHEHQVLAGGDPPSPNILKNAAYILRKALKDDPSLQLKMSEDGRTFTLTRIVKEEF